MTATSNSVRPSPIVSVDLNLPDSGQHGRAFLPLSILQSVKVDDLTAQFSHVFMDRDDDVRVKLIERVISRSFIDVETYPGETDPVELHAYLRCREESEDPIFACVLANNTVLNHLISTPPHIVFETATFQVVGESSSPTLVVAGLESWIKRLWPQALTPKIRLREWPNVENSELDSEEFFETWLRPLSPRPARGSRKDLALTDFELPQGYPSQ